MSQLICDKKFTKDLNDYLDYIQYDEKQIKEERQKVIKKILENEEAMSIICGNRI